MNRCVEVSFDCLPLRSISRLDVPMDASPAFRVRCERVLKAIESHGSHNSYYLYNAACIFHLTNRDDVGSLEFRFEGTALTDETDQRTERCYLEVELVKETCDWLTEPIVEWFKATVSHSVVVEFDRYIAAGDLEQTRKRIERLQSETEGRGGFVGMYL